jgi:hypothetical protein
MSIIASELVELQLIDSQGRGTTFYTYDGYYSKEDRGRIREYRREVRRRTYTAAFLVGLFTYYVQIMRCRGRGGLTWVTSAAAHTVSASGDCFPASRASQAVSSS